MAEDNQILRQMEAMKTTFTMQNKAVEEITARLLELADRLEPLTPVMEAMAATIDTVVSRLETVTLAQVELNKEMRQELEAIGQIRAERQRDQEARHLIP